MSEGLFGLLEVNQTTPQADLSVLEMSVDLDGASKVVDGPLRLAPPPEYLPHLVFRTGVSRVQGDGLPELLHRFVSGRLALRGLQQQSLAQPIVDTRQTGVSFAHLSGSDVRQLVMVHAREGCSE